MSIELGAVRAVVVFSDAPEQLASWYAEVFTLREVFRTTGFIGLAAGAVTIFVQKTGEGMKPGVGGIRPHFTVGDCRGAYLALLEAGARSLLPVSDAGGEWVAAVQDPDGNALGLLQPKG